MSATPDPKNPFQTLGVWGGLLFVIGGLAMALTTLVSKDGFSFKTSGDQLWAMLLVLVVLLGVAWIFKTLLLGDVQTGVALLDRSNPPAPLPPSATAAAVKRQGEG